MTYLHDLTRTARLDVPAAALALGYLALGLVAVRRGGAGWGIAAGAVFALAFLVKEIALPLAPVPFLAAILRGDPWRRISRVAGWTLATAAVGVSWWFLLVANLSGVVYRLGTPAWTLVPTRRSSSPSSRRSRHRCRPRTATLFEFETPGSRTRLTAVVLLTVAWCAALLWVFAGTLGVRGTDVIDVAQLSRYAATWLPGALKLVAGAGALGVVLSIAAWRQGRGEPRSAIVDLWLATICSAPLVLLVVEVGEPPRNYLAQIGILAALSAAGWLWLGEAVAPPDRGGETPASSTGWQRRCRAALVVLLVGASAVLAEHALTFRETSTGAARAAAITSRRRLGPGERAAGGDRRDRVVPELRDLARPARREPDRTRSATSWSSATSRHLTESASPASRSLTTGSRSTSRHGT